MSGFISVYKSVSELYSDLCLASRLQAVSDFNGATECSWCGVSLAKHLPDRRCTCSALSHKFKPIDQDARDKTLKALQLIEELQKL